MGKCDNMKLLGVTVMQGFPFWLAFPPGTQPGSPREDERKLLCVVLAGVEKQQVQLNPFPLSSIKKKKGVRKDFKACSPGFWWSLTAVGEGNGELQNKSLNLKGEAP